MRTEAIKVEWTATLLFILSIGFTVIFYLTIPMDSGNIEFLDFIIPVTGFSCALIIIPFTKRYFSYYSAQVFGVVCYLLTIFSTNWSIGIQAILLVVLLIELILFEPYPFNLFETIGLTIIATVVRTITLHMEGSYTLIVIIESHLPFFLPGIVISIMGSLMTKHRELFVDLTEINNHSKESLVNLARANTAYQNYAFDARETAEISERLRITRDIHDIVGYTLTNNMMLMEAALDLMKENPLALPAIIETSRSNTEEGLEQVRLAMYKLRDQESSYPVGMKAVARLVRIFEQATGIRIKCEFTNTPLIISNEIDSAIYHLIQEALVNSFRHGKATEADIVFLYNSETVEVHIRDNGVGSNQIKEGMGLKGMRERIEDLGGTVSAKSEKNGFIINAAIPLGGIQNAEQNSNINR